MSDRVAMIGAILLSDVMSVTPPRPNVAITILCVLWLGHAAWPSVVLAQGSNEHSLYVSVVDDDDTPIPDLTPTDFVVEEDGREREVLRVGPTSTPMQIALLVDTSAATPNATRDLRRGLEALAARLLDGNQVTLVTFGGPPRILVESTSRTNRLQDGIGQIFSVSNTAAYLLDALMETARGFERRESPRPVIIAITGEGLDHSSRNARQVLDLLKANNVETHVVVLRRRSMSAFNDPADQRALEDGRRERDLIISRAPRETGGRRHELAVSMRLGDTMEQLAHIITNQYEVVYARPTSLIPPEEIRVRARRAELTAHGTPARRIGD